jgi:hypothetical protein
MRWADFWGQVRIAGLTPIYCFDSSGKSLIIPYEFVLPLFDVFTNVVDLFQQALAEFAGRIMQV